MVQNLRLKPAELRLILRRVLRVKNSGEHLSGCAGVAEGGRIQSENAAQGDSPPGTIMPGPDPRARS